MFNTCLGNICDPQDRAKFSSAVLFYSSRQKLKNDVTHEVSNQF